MKSLASFKEHLDCQYGKRGTPARETFEAGFKQFKEQDLAKEAKRVLRLLRRAQFSLGKKPDSVNLVQRERS